MADWNPAAGSWVKVEVKGLRELQETLKRLPAVMQEKLVRQAASAGAKVIQDEVKRRAPVRSVPPGSHAGKRVSRKKAERRYPGNLKGHINRKRVNRGKGDSVSYDIFPSKHGWYGRLLEWGTRHASAHPFMRPSVDAKGSESIEKFRATIAAGLDRAV